MNLLSAAMEFSNKMVEARKGNNHEWKISYGRIRHDEHIAFCVSRMMEIKNTIKQIKNHGKAKQPARSK